MIENWDALLDRPEFALDRRQVGEAICGRRVLITGAGGSVGTALTRLVCSADPAATILFEAHEASLVRLGRAVEAQSGPGRAALVLGDVRDRARLDQTMQRHRPDVVFHLAAYKQVPLSEENVDQVLAVNVLGAWNVLEAAAAHGVSVVVYPSTDKAVDPPSMYGATKRVVEKMLIAWAQRGVAPAIRIVRLVNVFGTAGSVAEKFIGEIQSGVPIGVTDVGMDRYWMTMGEATHGLVAAAARPRYEGIYLLDVGQPVPIVETAKRIHRCLRGTGDGPTIRIIGIRPGERLHEILHYSDETVRLTDLDRLFAVETTGVSATVGAWASTLVSLRQHLYDLPLSSLRDWLAATATTSELVDPSAALRRQPDGRWS